MNQIFKCKNGLLQFKTSTKCVDWIIQVSSISSVHININRFHCSGNDLDVLVVLSSSH